MGDCRENEKISTGGHLWRGEVGLGRRKWLMKLIKRSIQICFLPSLSISRALARVCTLCFTLTTFCLFFVYLNKSCKKMCFNQNWTWDKGKRCGFCDILSQTLLLYLCKIHCMYAYKCFYSNVATPMAKTKKNWKKNQAHSTYYVEIPPYF